MKRYYQFDELKEKAFSVFEVLLEQRELKLTTNSLTGDQVAMTPAQIEAQVDALRKQAWGLAEAFMDHGQKYRRAMEGEVNLTPDNDPPFTQDNIERQSTDAEAPAERPKVKVRAK